mgnify:FL=1|tara:strand:- start:2336 stop:2629 length:294 start_codon:yes stop_codon:yes gene_type:complete
MAYKISNYSKRKAKKLGVVIKPSKVKHKKIAVFKNKKKVADIGDSRYNDFTTYTKLERAGKVKKGTAKTRRRLYKIRHNKNRNKKGTKSYFADKLLW